jgi:hypothetical protein
LTPGHQIKNSGDGFGKSSASSAVVPATIPRKSVGERRYTPGRLLTLNCWRNAFIDIEPPTDPPAAGGSRFGNTVRTVGQNRVRIAERKMR